MTRLVVEPSAVRDGRDAVPRGRTAGRRLRLFYASGPGDNIGTHRHWKRGEDDPSEPVVPYSSQFYDVCRELDADAYVVSTCPRRDRVCEDRLRIEHRPYAGRNARGARFHLAQLWYGLRLLATAVRFRPDVAIINEGVPWFLLPVLAWTGTAVVPSLHVKLEWQGRQGLAWNWIRTANRRFFRRHCRAVMVASRQIANQVAELTGPSHPPLLEFLPLYRPATFTGISPARHDRRPFHVLFVGRVEANKGVFDYFDMACRVSALRDDVEFHVCGVGSALAELQSRVSSTNASVRVHVHGYCDRARLSQMYDLAHVVVVPTRSSFGEGFNQVTAEAVLAGRPVVTSAVCPALDYVRDAVVEAEPDNVEDYTQAILKLASDSAFYGRKQQACLAAGRQFYDFQRSWGATLRQVVQRAGTARVAPASCRSG